MDNSKSKIRNLWTLAFIAIPVLYFAAQFLPYYHSGGTYLTSMWSLFWYSGDNEQTAEFIALFHHGFRVNDLIVPVFGSQIILLFLIVATFILKSRGTVAFLYGCWGIYGLITFLTTPALAFSRVMVYSGIAGILMLFIFLAAVVIAVVYLLLVHKKYKWIVSGHIAQLKAAINEG